MAKKKLNSNSETIVKRIRQLRTPREREATGSFYVEGTRIVTQAVRSGAEIELGVIAPELLANSQGWETVAALRAAAVPIVELSAPAFERISFKENLQGIGAVVRSQLEKLDDISIGEGLGWVALDKVGNSGNLGAILRTCDAVGCTGLMILDSTADPYHPAAVRASMGALFSQRLVRATFETFVQWKRKHEYRVIGTSGRAAQEYRQVSYQRPFILLMGSERLGLSAEQQAICDLVVHIPMIGTGDSLNLAVATSIVLYEIFHQLNDER